MDLGGGGKEFEGQANRGGEANGGKRDQLSPTQTDCKRNRRELEGAKGAEEMWP